MSSVNQLPSMTVSTAVTSPLKSHEYEDIGRTVGRTGTDHQSLTTSEEGGCSSSTGGGEHKRKSSFRKWLTTPVRKLSQGKFDRSVGGTAAPGTAALGGCAGERPPRACDHRSKPPRNERKTGKFSALKNLFYGTEDSKKGDESLPPSSPRTPTQASSNTQVSPSAEYNEELRDEPDQELMQASANNDITAGSSTSDKCPDSSTVNNNHASRHLAANSGTDNDEIDVTSSVIGQNSALPVTSDESNDNNSPPVETNQESKEEDQSAAALINEDTSMTLSYSAAVAGEAAEAAAGPGSGEEGSSEAADDTAAAAGDEPIDEAAAAETAKAKIVEKRKYVVMELIETEKDYIKDLDMIVEGYMKIIQSQEVTMPPGFEGKDKIVFGNIHQIVDWHRLTFQPELDRCLEEVERLGGLFVRYERRLYMYVKYCENKPKSEYIVSEYIDWFEEIRQKLGHRLQIPDLLIKPVQRIMKYQLMLKDILKYTERAGEDTTDLHKALQVMKVVPKAANDMMNVGRLQGFDGKITAQGKLLLQDTLQVMEQSSKGRGAEKQVFKERRVFLFEQIIIISEEVDRRRNNMSNSHYVFKHSIQINKMGLDDKSPGDPLRFLLIDKNPQSDLRLLCQVQTEEACQTWLETIRSILDMQGDFLRALQSPIAYQKELTKDGGDFDAGASLGLLGLAGAPGAALRKTNSQPLNSQTLPAGILPTSNHFDASPPITSDPAKYSRTKSVPLSGSGDQSRGGRMGVKAISSVPGDSTVSKVKGQKTLVGSSKSSPLVTGSSHYDTTSTTGSGSPGSQCNIAAGIRSTLAPSLLKSHSQEDINKPTKAATSPESSKTSIRGPIIEQPLSDLVVEPGCTAVFTCRVCAHPTPTLRWFGPPDGLTPLNESETAKFSRLDDNTAVLKLLQVRREQSGRYMCTATNESGSISTCAQLSVLTGSDSSVTACTSVPADQSDLLSQPLVSASHQSSPAPSSAADTDNCTAETTESLAAAKPTLAVGKTSPAAGPLTTAAAGPLTTVAGPLTRAAAGPLTTAAGPLTTAAGPLTTAAVIDDSLTTAAVIDESLATAASKSKSITIVAGPIDKSSMTAVVVTDESLAAGTILLSAAVTSVDSSAAVKQTSESSITEKLKLSADNKLAAAMPSPPSCLTTAVQQAISSLNELRGDAILTEAAGRFGSVPSSCAAAERLGCAPTSSEELQETDDCRLLDFSLLCLDSPAKKHNGQKNDYCKELKSICELIQISEIELNTFA